MSQTVSERESERDPKKNINNNSNKKKKRRERERDRQSVLARERADEMDFSAYVAGFASSCLGEVPPRLCRAERPGDRA